MKSKNYLPYVVSILIALAVGGLGAIATAKGMPAYEALNKPPLTPPGVVFPIVWTVLFVLMGISSARIRISEGTLKSRPMALYIAQLAVNLLWSVIFFACGARLAALVCLIVLWILILNMIWAFYPSDRPAALLQIPYFLWVTFAAYLNLGVWLLNR